MVKNGPKRSAPECPVECGGGSNRYLGNAQMLGASIFMGAPLITSKYPKCPPHPTHPHPFSFREYLPNPTDYLKKNVLPMGYKTCHVLNSSLDATICAKDCERLKEHKFGKDCKKKGGFFKCCIRRDKAFCNECRYIEPS